MTMTDVIVTTDYTTPTSLTVTPPTVGTTTQGDTEPPAGIGSILGIFGGILAALVIIIIFVVILVLVLMR